MSKFHMEAMSHGRGGRQNQEPRTRIQILAQPAGRRASDARWRSFRTLGLAGES